MNCYTGSYTHGVGAFTAFLDAEGVEGSENPTSRAGSYDGEDGMGGKLTGGELGFAPLFTDH